jgi:hypothetical protein
MATLRIPRGDTILIAGTFMPRGVETSLDGYTVLSEMTRGTTRLSLTYEQVSGADYELSRAGAQDMALGLWRTDVQFTDAESNVVSTEVYFIEIVEDVTGAGSP